MGGNALPEFNTVRLEREDYYQAEQLMSQILTQSNEWSTSEGRIRPILAYSEKSSFGDMDLLSTFTHEEFEAKLAQSDKVEVLGGHQNKAVKSYAVRFHLEKGWSAPFQVDHIHSSLADFDFAYHYYAYNDLGNLIGRIAAAMGMKFGHDGLYLKLYFNKEGRVVNVQGLKSLYVNGEQANASYKREVKLNVDFFSSLAILGFPVHRYLLGFKDLNEILDFVESSLYFHPQWFNLENRNAVQRRRDRKRPTYHVALERFNQKTPRFSEETIINNFNESLSYLYPIAQIKRKETKQVRAEIFKNKRLSFKRLSGILRYDYGLELENSGKAKKVLNMTLKALKTHPLLTANKIQLLNRQDLRLTMICCLDEMGFKDKITL